MRRSYNGHWVLHRADYDVCSMYTHPPTVRSWWSQWVRHGSLLLLFIITMNVTNGLVLWVSGFLIRSHDRTWCHVTFKMFVVEISLQSHRRSHDCTRCHVTFKMFVVEISLQSHWRSHDCTRCHVTFKMFVVEISLQSHRRSHDCTRCHVTFKMFVVEISLQSHRRSHDCTSLSNVLPSNVCCADFSTISSKVSWLHLIVKMCYLQMLLVQISLQSHCRSHDSTALG
jgi:hypothetical protein